MSTIRGELTSARDAEIQEHDGSDFAVLRAHLRLLSTPMRRGERAADREELLLADEDLAVELDALFEAYDRQRAFIRELRAQMKTMPGA